MLRKSTFMAAMATLFITTQAQAEDHQILVLPDAYFPETSYVSTGDSLVFINESDNSITVVSADEEWSTGVLAVDQSSTIEVVAGMVTDFFHEGQFDENGDPAVTGIISFGEAPIDEGSTDEEVQAIE